LRSHQQVLAQHEANLRILRGKQSLASSTSALRSIRR
jgi:hypothetical protein